jgi:hypothetical protein
MILADLPRDRHICPVTMFLALAIADGAIDGIHSSDEFSALASQEWSGIITLPYNNAAHHLPIFRRTGCKSKAISSCAMKPSALYKMMQAQMMRAGQEHTIANMVNDAKRSPPRVSEQSLKSDKPLMIGRGQAEDVSKLLGDTVKVHWTRVDWSSEDVTSRPLKIIPDLVEIQLRYDSTRRDIISCLYSARTMYAQLPDILWCFVNAALPVEPEPFYMDAFPDANGQCPHCGLRLGRYVPTYRSSIRY